MVSYKHPRPIRKTFRVTAPDFRDLEDVIRYRGTHHMRQEMHWFKEMAIQTAAKSFNKEWLYDNQQNFLTRLLELRYVNNYNDVEDIDYAQIQHVWHNVVLSIVDDLNEVDIFEYDHNDYVMEINVGKFTDHYIDLERILHERAERSYD